MAKRLTGLTVALGPLLVIALAYLVTATREIGLPGIYMDAVNPDYLVTRWLNPDAMWIPAWIAPGNDILGRYPLLIGLQHGSLQLWLGTPFYWIFGMSVVGLRLTHAMFALMVLTAWYAMHRTGGLPRSWLLAFGVALAIDPSFVYAFRNQSYITMAPVALLMLSVISLMRARTSNGKTRLRWLMGCGLLSGLACWGYFIYAFFVPALLIASWLMPIQDNGRSPRFAYVLATGLGLSVGAALYTAGFLLVARQVGGLSEGIAYYFEAQPGLHTETAVTTVMRLTHVKQVLNMVISNSWNHAMMFSKWAPTPAAAYKFYLLVWAPPLFWLLAEWRRSATPLLRIVMGLLFSFLLSAVLFGPRTNGHHFMALVPLSYAGLALAAFAASQAGLKKAVQIAAAVILMLLLLINTAGNIREVEDLRRTGGVGMSSDAINRLGTDLYEGDHNKLLILPDWGLYMPVAFLTRASMEMRSSEDFEVARQRLCEGKDVIVGLITGDRAERFRHWQTRLDWSEPMVTTYQQRDGKVVFEVATFSAQDAENRCSAVPRQ